MEFLNILTILSGACSSALVLFTFIGFIAGKGKSGKERIKKILGIVELSEKIDNISLKYDKVNDEVKKQSNALLAQTRKDLKYMCTDAIKKDYVTINEREMISRSFEAYRDLGGNSFICGLVGKVMELEIHEDEY